MPVIFNILHLMEKADKILEKITENLGEDSSEISMKEALTDPKYKRATIVNMWYCFFHEVAAINVINYYSNQIFNTVRNSNPKSNFNMHK